jgi:hypothetical protein
VVLFINFSLLSNSGLKTFNAGIKFVAMFLPIKLHASALPFKASFVKSITSNPTEPIVLLTTFNAPSNPAVASITPSSPSSNDSIDVLIPSNAPLAAANVPIITVIALAAFPNVSG